MSHMIIKGGVAAVGGVVAFLLGGLDNLLIALTVVIVLDYLTGILQAVHNQKLSSEIGFKGIVKKIFIVILVMLAHVVGSVFVPNLPLREITITFFIANEGISILENAAKAELPIPKALQKTLLQLRDREGTNE